MPNQGRVRLPDKIGLGVKYYPAWKRSLKLGANALSDRVPWVTFEALDFISPLLTPSATVFEYGSGGSTLYYSKRVKRVISIEYDQHWAAQVKRALIEEGLNNCECRMIPPKTVCGVSASADDPGSYYSSAEEHREHSFRDYVCAIDSFPDQFFDYVAVDGRARPSCLYHVRSKVKIGGHLMLDNSERAHYQRTKELLSDWEVRDFYGPGPYNLNFWETTVWRRVSR